MMKRPTMMASTGLLTDRMIVAASDGRGAKRERRRLGGVEITVVSKLRDGHIWAKRTDGKPLTAADREAVKRFVKLPGITADDVIAVFGGGMVVHPELKCSHCNTASTPAWRRGGKVVEARWPDGRVSKLCHYCGRAVLDTYQELKS